MAQTSSPSTGLLGAILDGGAKRSAGIQNTFQRHDESADVLGEDLLEIRRRVLAATQGAGTSSADEASANREVYEELRRRHQADTNEEEIAAALEDPTLRSHMEAARQRLASYEADLARLPKLEALRTQYLDAMCALSKLVKRLDAALEADGPIPDVVWRVEGALAKLSEGKSAHGVDAAVGVAASAEPRVAAGLKALGTMCAKAAKATEGAAERLKGIRQDTFVLRRDIEKVGDGLIELVEGSEKARREQKDFLATVAKHVRSFPAPEAMNVDTSAAGKLPPRAAPAAETSLEPEDFPGDAPPGEMDEVD
jgi:hypothetical protein